MDALLVGYARVSTEHQDLTAQRNGLHDLGVGDDRIYVDHGLTGQSGPAWTPARPGRLPYRGHSRRYEARPAGAVAPGRSRHPRGADTPRGTAQHGRFCHESADPVGRLLFNVLAMVAEFESDLIRLRTREGMKVAREKGRLRGKQPKLTPNQARHLLELDGLGPYSCAGLAEMFNVGRSTIYRTLHRLRPMSTEPERPFLPPTAAEH